MIENYISNLKEGMVIKNYLTLCNILHEDVKIAASKTCQIKNWQRYFEYKINGQKWTILKVYNEPLSKVDLRANGNNTKHNLYKKNKLLHGVWCGMRSRCNNPNHPFYINYGGRGIKVCNEWDDDFLPFYTWAMKNGYKENVGLSIDRIDVDGNYEPNNCRWVDNKIQIINRRKTKGCVINNKDHKKEYIIQVVDGLYITYLIYKNKTYPVGTFNKEDKCMEAIDTVYNLLESYY